MRALAALCLPALLAGPAAVAGELTIRQISKSVWMAAPAPGSDLAVSNAAFVVLPDRVLLFDTLSSAALLRELMEGIAGVTALPVTMVALSHGHPDHAGGLDYFARAPVTLAATRATAEDIEARRISLVNNLEKRERDLQRQVDRAVDSTGAGDARDLLAATRREKLRILDLPRVELSVEITSSTELSPGGKTCFLQHHGPGHTGGDLMLHVVDEKVLLAGDLLSVRTLPNLADGHSAAWIDRLNEIEKMDVETIIPGHGPAGTKQDLIALRAYLETLRAMVLPIVAEGGTSRDLVQKLRVPAPYDSWASSDLWFPATLRAFQELKGDAAPASR